MCFLDSDDIIVHSREFGKVIKSLCTVSQRLHNAGLKLSFKKCILFQQSVPFLDHVVSDHNVSTDPKKIEAVCTWPSPRTAMDVKSFLGLCSYYRCFAPGFADIARPFYRVTEGQRQFQWTSECEDTFCQLKTLLTLVQYSLKSKGGNEKVIAFHNKSLSKSERNCCVTRKEL